MTMSEMGVGVGMHVSGQKHIYSSTFYCNVTNSQMEYLPPRLADFDYSNCIQNA